MLWFIQKAEDIGTLDSSIRVFRINTAAEYGKPPYALHCSLLPAETAEARVYS